MKQKTEALIAGLGDQAIFARLVPRSTLALLGFTTTPSKPQRTWHSSQGRIETRKYASTTSDGATTAITISRDGWEVVVKGMRGKELIFRCAVRDRGLDGSGPRGTQSPLNPFPVSHQLANALPHRDFRSAELTVYSYDITDSPIDSQLRQFIADPDRFMFPWSQFDPKRFFPLWDAAFASGLAPWQMHHPLRGFAPQCIDSACQLLQELGYHRAEVVPGWYNAAVFFEKRLGFRYLHAEHEAAAQLLHSRVAEMNARLPEPLTAWQQAWVVALQNVPRAYLQGSYKRFDLGSIHWQNSPSNTDYCVRLYKDLNEFCANDIP